MTIHRRIAALAAAAALGFAGAVALPTAALAADVFVTSNADNGPGSLRAALENSLPGDTIRFDSSFDVAQTIELETGLTIDHTITIVGPGSGLLTIARDDASTFNQFNVAADVGVTDIDVSISGLAIDGSVGGVEHAGDGVGFQSIDSTVNNLSFTDVVFENQSATHGAGINVESVESTITFTDSAIFNNIAEADGGGGRFDADADIAFVDTSISSNEANGGNGGGISVLGTGVFTFLSGGITSNYSSDFGGGLYLQGSTDIVLDFAFAQLNSADRGGVVYVNIFNGSFDVTRSEFNGNTATNGDGGAINVQTLDQAQSFTVTDSVFQYNEAEGDGPAFGAAIRLPNVDGVATIESSTFASNSFGQLGFGLAVATNVVNGTFTMVNSTVDELEPTEETYALYFDGISGVGEVSVENSTITGPGGILVGSTADAAEKSISNSIVNGTDPDAGAVLVVEGTIDTSYSLFSDPFGATYADDGSSRFGITNFGLMPLAENGGLTPTRLLTASSPALNNGDPAFGAALAFDQRGDGYPRVVGRLDIGAIEMPGALANTGSTGLPVWVPIVGGIVLLAGIGFVVFSALNRRRGAAAGASAGTINPEPTTEPAQGDTMFPTASTLPPTVEPPAENDPR